MYITKAKLAEVSRISEIYDAAREYMRRAGNAHQWGGGYPSDATIREDIEKERLYVCKDEDGDILGVFCYFFGSEPTYREIFEGEWLTASGAESGANDEEASRYGVMHRVAVADHAHGRGVAAYCFDFCFERCGDLRIDTHRDNIPMQKALARAGFSRRGIIYLENGDERIAFQKNGVRKL